MTIAEKLKLMDAMREKNEQALRMMGQEENSKVEEGAEDV